MDARREAPTGYGGPSAQLEPQEPERPLLLVPGICGTMLHVRERGKGDEGEGDRVWVTLQNADASYQRLWGRFDERSGSVELLEEGTEVVVPRGTDASGLYPISVLDPEAAFAVRGVHYFDAWIKWLEDMGYTAGKDLFGFGYDFRQSTRAHSAALLARLQDVSRRSGGRKVDLVCHSMGGLVVRSLLAQSPREFEALVHTWVAVGTPFGGAPGYAVDALITGVQFAGSLGQYFFVDRATFRQACLQSPAILEMIPPLDFPFQQPPPQLRIWLSTPIPSAMPSSVAAPSAEAQLMTPDGPPQLQANAQQPPGAPGGPLAQLAALLGRRLPGGPIPPRPSALCPPATPDGNSASTATPPSSVASSRTAAAGASSGGATGLQPGCGGSGSSDGVGSGSGGGAPANQAKEYIFAYSDLPGLLERLLASNTVNLNGREYSLPFSQPLWDYAQDTHRAWAGAKLPPGCRFFNLYGAGLSTPYDAQYGAWWYAVKDLEHLELASASFSYVDGDMTVPAESAVADGLEAEERMAVRVAHRDLVATPAVWEQVLAWLRRGSGDSWLLVPPATPSSSAH